MRRRRLIASIAASAFAQAIGSPARAEPASGRRPRVVWLGARSADLTDPRQLDGLRQGLAANGLIDGETIDLQALWAEDSVEHLQKLCIAIAEAGTGIDVVVTAGAQPARALLAAGGAQPIVMAAVCDAVGAGLVKSLDHPDGRITGLSISTVDLETRRIALLKELVPSLARVLVLHDPATASEGLAAARRAADALDIEALVIEATDPAAFGPIFAAAAADGVDGASIMASPFFDHHRAALIAIAARHRLPAIWERAVWTREGGLASYRPSLPDLYRRAAGYVARLLAGATPADLPIEPPTRFELVLNRSTAAALDLALPPGLLARADEVVE